MRQQRAFRIWLGLVMVLLGPALLAWLVRGLGFAFGCTPGPTTCHSLPLGLPLRVTLDLAWLVTADLAVLIILALAAAIAALVAQRPVLATASAFSLPMAAIILPTLAAFSSGYRGCMPDESISQECPLWGASMGMSLHNAAMAQWLLYMVIPYSVAAAVVLGLIGLVFFRRRQTAPSRPFL